MGILRISSPEREVRRTEPYAQLCFLLCPTKHMIALPSQGLDEELRDQFQVFKSSYCRNKSRRQEEAKVVPPMLGIAADIAPINFIIAGPDL